MAASHARAARGAVSGAAGPDARHPLHEKSNNTGGEGQDARGLSTPIKATHKRAVQ